MPSIFFTGFPGFLGTELLPRVLARSEDATAVCLIQAKFRELAKRRVEELVDGDARLEGRIELVEGDITKPDLGLGDDYDRLTADTVEIFHLAAVYDLSVPRDLAMRVNVEGTEYVCDFAEACEGLDRLQYVSTCYVSGRYAGIFRETDLQKGQKFNNFYEETKHLAEVVVQERMQQGLPATISRPSVVAGDSKTGATQKYDGPYFVIRMLLRQPRIAVVPMIGNPEAYRFNFVPRDFVVDAIAHLSAEDVSKGKVYALADPEPATIAELVEMFGESTGRRLITIPVTQNMAKLLTKIPGLGDRLELPADAVNYFTHPTHYTTDNASQDLEGTGITLPETEAYVRRLAAFVKANPDITSDAMV